MAVVDILCKRNIDMAVKLRIEMRHILPQWILTCCTMRRRSLRLLSPNLCLNSDGDTGAFFGVKNYRREFFAPKPSA